MRRAIALRYDPERERAPDVVAKAQGEMAERVLDIARRHGIPIHEDTDLFTMLAACDLGREIPLELFSVVAELLAYLYRLNGEWGGNADPSPSEGA